MEKSGVRAGRRRAVRRSDGRRESFEVHVGSAGGVGAVGVALGRKMAAIAALDFPYYLILNVLGDKDPVYGQAAIYGPELLVEVIPPDQVPWVDEEARKEQRRLLDLLGWEPPQGRDRPNYRKCNASDGDPLAGGAEIVEALALVYGLDDSDSVEVIVFPADRG